MQFINEYQTIVTDRQKNYHKQAEQERIRQSLRPRRGYITKIYQVMLMRIGTLLSQWGQRLQVQHDDLCKQVDVMTQQEQAISFYLRRNSNAIERRA